MAERTKQELYQLQALPLDLKVEKTKLRIREWVDEFGVDGVYVSFSGGKDSTVLLTICRELYPDIKAVFFDTGLEYPEIREFVKTWDNVDWIKPKLTFKEVINKYGYPFISKEVSERVQYAQRYLARHKDEIKGEFGSYEWAAQAHKLLKDFSESDENGTYKIRELYAPYLLNKGEKSKFNYSKWRWLSLSPYPISNNCCQIMKKSPAYSYENKTGRKAIMGQTTSESRLRTMNWLHYGCNGFNRKKPISNPLSFWLEQDILLYLQKNKIPIASVYGDIVADDEDDGIDGQMSLETVCKDCGVFDKGRSSLRTTGCNRTGCMFCGYGCHMEKPGEGRFELMKESHPKQYEYIMKPWEEGGLGYKEVIDWINEHGNLHIRY